MSKLEDGIAGFVTGKIGSVTYYKRNGKYYMRRSIVTNTSKTKKQQSQRGRFGVAIKAFSPLSEAFRLGFASQSVGARTGFNAGVGYNMRNALVQGEEGYSVDWSLVACSQGSLPMLEGVTLEGGVESGLVARWQLSAGADGRDEVCMAVYDHETRQCWLAGRGSALRESGVMTVRFPQSYRNHTLEVYLFAVSAKGDEASDTVYAGQIVPEK